MNNIARYRRIKGFTQAELANMVGISRTYLSFMENGRADPTDEQLAEIAEKLEVRVEQLLSVVDPISNFINLLTESTVHGSLGWRKKPGKINNVETDDTLFETYISEQVELEGDDKATYYLECDFFSEIKQIELIVGYNNTESIPKKIADSLGYNHEIKKLYQVVKNAADEKNFIYKEINRLEKLLKKSE